MIITKCGVVEMKRETVLKIVIYTLILIGVGTLGHFYQQDFVIKPFVCEHLKSEAIRTDICK